jgi:hypothetical protein
LSCASDAADLWIGQINLPTGNFIENGSFERGLNDWEPFKGESVTQIDSSTFSSGHAGLRESGVSDKNFYLYQYNVPLETGKTYTLSAMVKTQGLSEAQRKMGVVTLTNYGWTDSVSLVPDQSTMDWKRLSITFKAMATQPRPDGQPTYSLVIYWAPQTQGTVWLDDVQLEAGDKASDFRDISAIAAIDTSNQLHQLVSDLLSTREAAAQFENKDLANRTSAGLEPLFQAATAVRDSLRNFDQLPIDQQHDLTQKVTDISQKLGSLQTTAWLSAADVPLHQLKPPTTIPENLQLQLTCVQGEHRDVALNLANLTEQGYAARLSPSALYQRAYAISTPAAQWVQLYSVPNIRGYAQPARIFTDPLPEIDNAGILHIEPAAISQAIVSIDTSQLFPGLHEGTIRFESLSNAACHFDVKVTLRVLPLKLSSLQGIDIADCFGHTEYAWPGIEQLGINTFTLNVSWTNAIFDKQGKLTMFEFDRLARQVKEILAHDNSARFHFLSCDHIVRLLQSRYGWKPGQAEFESAFTQWITALASNMNNLGISPSRLRIETIDEPGPADLKLAAYVAGLIKKTAPDMQTQIYLSGVSRDADWQTMAKAHDIITPIAASCTPDNMKYLKSLGRQLWIYDCQANGETLNPIAYYRLMPWMCREYGAVGWSQFSWVNTPHGRPYVAWDGVEAQNMVYPSADGLSSVISRRWLALRAGQEDYRLLDLLDSLIADAPNKADNRVVNAHKFADQAGAKALAISPRQPGYQTHINPDAPQGLLDDLRSQTTEHIANLLELSAAPKLKVTNLPDGSGITVNVSAAGELNLRYIVNGELPWRVFSRPVAAGTTEIKLTRTLDSMSRCIVGYTSDDGRIAVQNKGIIPLVSSVDSTAEGYSTEPINDGIRAVAAKFEPGQTWISGQADQEHWIVLDLQGRSKINSVSLYWMTYTGLPQQFMIQYKDGVSDADWKAVSATPQWIAADAPIQQVQFAPVFATTLRLLVAKQGGGIGGPTMFGVSEIEINSAPSQ